MNEKPLLEYIVEYAIKKSIFKSTIIKAPTYTKAYVAFMLQFPEDYEITNIKLNSPVEA